MSEVEAGIAQLGDKIKAFLSELFIKVEEVEERHCAYMKYRQEQYRARAESSALMNSEK